MPDIWTILDWIFYGLIRYVFYLIPLVRAPVVARSTPDQWWPYNDWWDWTQRTADNGHPNEHWCRSWLEMAFGELQRLATERARPYVDAMTGALRSLVGYIRPGFGSLGSWVDWLQSAVGTVLPHFALNLGAASVWLYNRLPAGVRGGWQNWDQIWENIKSAVRSWAMARFDAARAWARSAFDWVNQIGDSLRSWRSSVAGWIDQVRYNPRGFVLGVLGSAWHWLEGFSQNARDRVLGWLGPDWPRLRTFARDCVGFYYSLWSQGWQILGMIIDDPKSFVFDRLERAIMDRW